ncbi:MAG TPA: metallophosphoesterase family protein [Gaiellaceae bacterium]
MRVAVISDIHGNHHALTAVLDAIGDEVDAIWCLGDLVGYGARPNECCATVSDAAAICLVGNHDLGVTGSIDLADFSPDAAAAAQWSRAVLTAEARVYLKGRQTTAKANGAELFHASPRDPVWEYVLTDEAARAAIRLTSAPVVLVGHSHVAFAYPQEGRSLGDSLAPADTEVDLAASRWLLNPGSVGQPRDGDPRAAYVILDLDRKRALFHRVPYAVERTQEEILDAGLPETLAGRLALGM